MEVKKTVTKITVNGREYGDVGEMTAEDRRVYDESQVKLAEGMKLIGQKNATDPIKGIEQQLSVLKLTNQSEIKHGGKVWYFLMGLLTAGTLLWLVNK